MCSWSFGPFLLTELVQLGQVCRLPHSRFSFFPTLCDGIKVRALWCPPQHLDTSNTLLFLSLSRAAIILEFMSFWKSHVWPSFRFPFPEILLQFFHISQTRPCWLIRKDDVSPRSKIFYPVYGGSFWWSRSVQLWHQVSVPPAPQN